MENDEVWQLAEQKQNTYYYVACWIDDNKTTQKIQEVMVPLKEKKYLGLLCSMMENRRQERRGEFKHDGRLEESKGYFVTGMFSTKEYAAEKTSYALLNRCCTLIISTIERKLEVSEIRILRWTMGLIKKDRIEKLDNPRKV